MQYPPERPDPDTSEHGAHRFPRAWLVPVVIIAALGLGALAVNAASTGGADTGSGTTTDPTSSTPVLAPPAPDRLRARATPFRVTLTWEPGVGGGDVDHWVISRDGAAIGTVDGIDQRFVDDEVLPRKVYRYEVTAMGDGETTGSAGKQVRTRTPVPPLSQARFGGVYDVRLRVESSYGITGLDGSTGAWRATPACGEGTCDVHLKSVHGDLPPMDARQRRAAYEAEGSGRFGFACGDVPQTSSYDLNVRVVAADTIAGSWRATTIEGSLRLSMPEQLGCRSGGVSYKVIGRLVEGA